MLYHITQNMWKHRNDKLYHNTTASSSLKRRKKVTVREVKIHSKISFGAVRNKDKKLVCTHLTTQKKWKAPLFEAWLRSVTLLRKRTGGCNIKDLGCTLRKMHYIQRMENLKRISIPKFHRWRMTHHASTLTDHVCSAETQEWREVKKC